METVFDHIVNTINNEPEKCTCDQYRFCIGDIKFWIANGFLFLRLDDCEYPHYCLSLYQKWLIWRAFKRWVRGAPKSHFSQRRFNKPPPPPPPPPPRIKRDGQIF